MGWICNSEPRLTLRLGVVDQSHLVFFYLEIKVALDSINTVLRQHPLLSILYFMKLAKTFITLFFIFSTGEARPVQGWQWSSSRDIWRSWIYQWKLVWPGTTDRFQLVWYGSKRNIQYFLYQRVNTSIWCDIYSTGSETHQFKYLYWPLSKYSINCYYVMYGCIILKFMGSVFKQFFNGTTFRQVD